MTWAQTIFAVLIWKWRRDALPGPNPSSALNKFKDRSRLIAIFVVAVVLAATAAPAGAGCNEDCKSEYVSALGECRTQYEKGDQDLQDLEDCLVDTRGEYDDCIDDCTSLGAGGVVACASPGAAITPVSFATLASDRVLRR
jgi:hypothetical protein